VPVQGDVVRVPFELLMDSFSEVESLFDPLGHIVLFEEGCFFFLLLLLSSFFFFVEMSIHLVDVVDEIEEE